jgi:hypothetical protein
MKVCNSFLPCVLFICFIINGAFGQTDTTKAANNIRPKEPRSSTQLNYTVKIEPTLLANGDFPLFFERRITGKLTGVAGLGVTGRDIIFHFIDNQIDQHEDKDKGSLNRTRLGASFRAGLRFYPSSNTTVPEGFYFALLYQVKRYNWEQNFDLQNNVQSKNREYRRISDVLFQIGYQHINKYNMAFDVYTGLGFRSQVVRHGLRINDDSAVQMNTHRQLLPALYLGGQVGFAF